MLKTKPKPKTVKQRSSKSLSTEVFTLAEAASYLRLPTAEVVRLAEEEDLPGRRVGKDWRLLKRAIDTWLSLPKGQRQGIWAAAGILRDDPYLDEMLESLEQMRGRPTADEED